MSLLRPSARDGVEERKRRHSKDLQSRFIMWRAVAKADETLWALIRVSVGTRHPQRAVVCGDRATTHFAQYLFLSKNSPTERQVVLGQVIPQEVFTQKQCGWPVLVRSGVEGGKLSLRIQIVSTSPRPSQSETIYEFVVGQSQ